MIHIIYIYDIYKFILYSKSMWYITRGKETQVHILIISARQNLCTKLESKYLYVHKQLKNSILLQYIQY